MKNNKTEVICDLTVCQPNSAISSAGEKNRWRSIQYETETGIAGNLLYAGEECVPEKLTLPLNLKGRYKIYVGLGATSGFAMLAHPAIKLKLKSESHYSLLNATGRTWWLDIRECFWREATLDGESLDIAKVKGVQSSIAYIRFEPSDIERNIDIVDDRYFMVTNDSYWEYHNIEEVLEPIYALRESPVKKLCFCIATGDNCTYLNTTVGSSFDYNQDIEYSRVIDRKIYEARDQLKQQESDVIGRVCDLTHEIGLEFHASYRIGAFINQPPFDTYFKSDFYQNNPQLRCCDYDGREITRLSYAFEDVQEHMLALYEEALQYDIDGLNLIFVRALPVMLYEKPLLEGFQKLYHKNALELPENDPEYLKYRASIFTRFMRKIRKRMDDVRLKQNRKPLEISIICPANKQVNEFFGLDLETWIKEGLVDTICPDFSLQTRDHDDSDPNNIEMDYFLSITKDTDCELLPRLPHYTLEPEKYIEYFQQMEQLKIPGMMLWDGAANFVRKPEVWEYIKSFGHVKPENLSKRILLKSLGGFVTDKYPAHLAF